LGASTWPGVTAEQLAQARTWPTEEEYLADNNPNTTQTLGYTKDKYNTKRRKQRVSPKVSPTTYKGRRIK
jgi:hypothetical protein